jgi:SAM-dependent methyltransferase
MPVDLNRLEGAFYDYMHQLGQFGPEWNRDVLSFYVPMFANCRLVLDVGCGEGEFMQLLRDKGVKALGIDSDARMVEGCLGKGLDVVQTDLFDYLPEHQGEFDGIFNSNLIEHLSAQDAARFVQACYGALCVGGTLVMATPNPASLIVQLHEFWRDATHVRLYSRPLLEFLLHWAGFRDIESGEHPGTVWTLPPDMDELPRLLAGIAGGGAEPTGGSPFSLHTELADGRQRSAPRRLSYALRRRFAGILARNVLYEEFASLQHVLEIQQHALEIQQRAIKTLYGSHAGMLTRARECYARGVKALQMAPEEG